MKQTPKTVYSYQNPRPCETPPDSGTSRTIPDQTMSIRELYSRYAKGLPLEARIKQPLYYEGEFPDLDKLDLSEIHQLKKQVAMDVEQMQKQLQETEQMQKIKEQKKLTDRLTFLEAEYKKQQAPEAGAPQS